MDHPINKIFIENYPPLLKEIKNPPKYLYIQGTIPPPNYVYLCIIGSRNHSSYGKDACTKLIRGLSNYPITIVSGLATGIDSIAHETALDSKITTIAFPGTGLAKEVLFPPEKIQLASRIVQNGGALISSFELNQFGTKWTFPARNRLMAAASKAVLIIEGKQGSGTLGTAQYATDFNRDVMVVPGSIFSELSYGPHLLMRDGAYPVTNSNEILDILGFKNINSPITTNQSLFTIQYSPLEKEIIEKLTSPLERDELIRNLNISLSQANATLSELEIKGIITEESGIIRLVRIKN